MARFKSKAEKDTRRRHRFKLLDLANNPHGRLTDKELLARYASAIDTAMAPREMATALAAIWHQNDVKYVQQAHHKQWKVNGEAVPEFELNNPPGSGEVASHTALNNEESEAILERNWNQNRGRDVAHIARIKRFERVHPLTTQAIRRRKKLEQFIFSLGL